MNIWPLEYRFLRFSAFGLVVVAWSFGLNILLNEWFHLYPPAAYAIVVASQFVIGFLLNRYCVFDGRRAPFLAQFLKYVSALALLRGLDWAFYTVEVEFLAIPYLCAQAANTVLIFLAKFFIYKRVFKGKPSGPTSEDS